MNYFKKNWAYLLSVFILSFAGILIVNTNMKIEALAYAYERLLDKVEAQQILIDELILNDQVIAEKSTQDSDFNDVKGSVFCCGWDFYTYDATKDETLINPLLVPISIHVKGELPDYIAFTQLERNHFTFFYKANQEYYPIMSYRVVSKAAIQYGWGKVNDINPDYDLGNGFVIVVADPNVPSSPYDYDDSVRQKMQDFMSLVSFEVIR